MNRKLVEYKDALEDFKSTNQARAEEYYANLKRQNPVIITYDQILEKLRKICALPQMLGSYIDTPTIDQANDIYGHCMSILYMHERSEYDSLFKTYTYLDPQGFQHEPEYGKWTYKGHIYKMENMITDIQDIMDFVSR
jgi:hypothetical protein